MKQIGRLLRTMALTALAVGLIFPVAASAELVKKADNFIIFLDQSGSMAWAKAAAGNQKLDYAIDDVKRFDQATPELGYASAVYMFAPFQEIAAAATYQNGALVSAVDRIKPPFNFFTPMGDGLNDLDPVIGQLAGRTALIMFTDGEANQGADPVAAAKGLYGKYAPNLCIHVVSYADTAEGQQVIDGIRALSGCTVVADHKSLATDAAMAQFARDVLYDERMPAPAPVAPAPAPAPPPPPPPVAKEVITFNLLFDFDKSDIRPDMVPQLERAKAILSEDRMTRFDVTGHTCWIGSEEYNQGLSERRAAAVKGWLIDNGVDGARLDTVGFGELQPKYDNNTLEGRKLNRRVELRSK